MSSLVRKVVFPAAGLGTRFLPATKAQPKEMLPLVDKPTIQYGVEEALQSGVPNIVVVTGRGKNAIEDHFDVSKELEAFLESRGKKDLADEGAQDLEPDPGVVRAPGRAAGPRPRRPRHRDDCRQ
jgi:UTP--glucose-1-phosphate uridylyltransferase